MKGMAMLKVLVLSVLAMVMAIGFFVAVFTIGEREQRSILQESSIMRSQNTLRIVDQALKHTWTLSSVQALFKAGSEGFGCKYWYQGKPEAWNLQLPESGNKQNSIDDNPSICLPQDQNAANMMSYIFYGYTTIPGNDPDQKTKKCQDLALTKLTEDPDFNYQGKTNEYSTEMLKFRCVDTTKDRPGTNSCIENTGVGFCTGNVLKCCIPEDDRLIADVLNPDPNKPKSIECKAAYVEGEKDTPYPACKGYMAATCKSNEIGNLNEQILSILATPPKDIDSKLVEYEKIIHKKLGDADCQKRKDLPEGKGGDRCFCINPKPDADLTFDPEETVIINGNTVKFDPKSEFTWLGYDRLQNKVQTNVEMETLQMIRSNVEMTHEIEIQTKMKSMIKTGWQIVDEAVRLGQSIKDKTMTFDSPKKFNDYIKQMFHPQNVENFRVDAEPVVKYKIANGGGLLDKQQGLWANYDTQVNIIENQVAGYGSYASCDNNQIPPDVVERYNNFKTEFDTAVQLTKLDQDLGSAQIANAVLAAIAQRESGVQHASEDYTGNKMQKEFKKFDDVKQGENYVNGRLDSIDWGIMQINEKVDGGGGTIDECKGIGTPEQIKLNARFNIHCGATVFRNKVMYVLGYFKTAKPKGEDLLKMSLVAYNGGQDTINDARNECVKTHSENDCAKWSILESDVRDRNEKAYNYLMAKDGVWDNIQKWLSCLKSMSMTSYSSVDVVIDPGHAGTYNSYLDTSEAQNNFAVAEKLRDKLSAIGYKVLLTKNSVDEEPTLFPYDEDRRDFSPRRDVAVKSNAALFVSIHSNALDGQEQGVETYVYCIQKGEENDGSKNIRSESEISKCVPQYSPRIDDSKNIAHSVTDNIASDMGLNNRGIKSADFGVIESMPMPAVLVEMFYHDNQQDIDKVKGKEDELAESIKNGIVQYLQSHPRDISSRVAGVKGFQLPVKSSTAVITQCPEDHTRDGSHDAGIDISVSHSEMSGIGYKSDPDNRKGSPIYAAGAGVIEAIHIGHDETSGYGNRIIIKHQTDEGTVYTFYAHLYHDISVKKGQQVLAGQQIGTMGATGHVGGSTGVHLHFEVGKSVNIGTTNPQIKGERLHPCLYVDCLKYGKTCGKSLTESPTIFGSGDASYTVSLEEKIRQMIFVETDKNEAKKLKVSGIIIGEPVNNNKNFIFATQDEAEAFTKSIVSQIPTFIGIKNLDSLPIEKPKSQQEWGNEYKKEDNKEKALQDIGAEGYRISKDLSNIGFNIYYGPNTNFGSSENNFGNDEIMISELAKSYLSGLQQNEVYGIIHTYPNEDSVRPNDRSLIDSQMRVLVQIDDQVKIIQLAEYSDENEMNDLISAGIAGMPDLPVLTITPAITRDDPAKPIEQKAKEYIDIGFDIVYFRDLDSESVDRIVSFLKEQAEGNENIPSNILLEAKIEKAFRKIMKAKGIDPESGQQVFDVGNNYYYYDEPNQRFIKKPFVLSFRVSDWAPVIDCENAGIVYYPFNAQTDLVCWNNKIWVCGSHIEGDKTAGSWIDINHYIGDDQNNLRCYNDADGQLFGFCDKEFCSGVPFCSGDKIVSPGENAYCNSADIQDDCSDMQCETGQHGKCSSYDPCIGQCKCVADTPETPT